jgi:hypothetical protein
VRAEARRTDSTDAGGERPLTTTALAKRAVDALLSHPGVPTELANPKDLAARCLAEPQWATHRTQQTLQKKKAGWGQQEGPAGST